MQSEWHQSPRTSCTKVRVATATCHLESCLKGFLLWYSREATIVDVDFGLTVIHIDACELKNDGVRLSFDRPFSLV